MKSNFTMCSNQECVNAEYCERHTAERQKRQPFKYFLNEGDKCEHFIPNDKYRVFAKLAGKDENLPKITRIKIDPGFPKIKIMKNRYSGPAFYAIDLETQEK
jgi:hypothetical protein